ncbi:MAG TPA: hypothetical protein VHJ78_02590 [Actinomycetota bacterium]|nr:hypothetical protein [Actinomycetota bacterium]
MSPAHSPENSPSEPESESPKTQSSSPAPEEPARHILRRRTVEHFLRYPDVPEGAIPAAVRHVIGGPPMWSERPIRTTQFTPEQRELLLQAALEIRELYEAAGGAKPRMLHDEALGLMPDNAAAFPYQSEEWAAAKAYNAALPFAFSPHLPEPERERAELAQAYHMVITWIDYVKGGLLDASEIYENDDPDV